MKALMVEPDKVPYEVDVPSGYQHILAALECDYFTVTYPFEDLVGLLVDDEGKITKKPLNRALFDEDGNIYDIIAGKFMVVGLGEETFEDLSPELMEKFKERFKHPESFMQLCGKIVAIKKPIPGEGTPDKSHTEQTL